MTEQAESAIDAGGNAGERAHHPPPVGESVTAFVGFDDVRLLDGFWRPILERNRDITVPHNLRMCREVGVIGNFEKAAELNTEGVTCEYCHGPGSEYKKLSIMKNKEKAAENGLIVYQSEDDIEEMCLVCHGQETFEFHPFWDKIRV